jgi:uncharacterized protein RhaS with RHS repeats
LHRHYDAGLGRYTQPDPLGVKAGPSVYGYVGGNPVMGVDPEGLQAQVGVLCGPYWLPCSAAITGAIWLMSPSGQKATGDLGQAIDGLCNSDNDRCNNAKRDAELIYHDLTSKRIPQYLSGGTRGRDANHLQTIVQKQNGLKNAIRRVYLYCNPLPPEIGQWERTANMAMPN